MPRFPVLVVGAGPSGLAAAIDLAQSGIKVCVVEARDGTGSGSRAVCYSRRTLEVLDRLGFAHRCTEKGVSWDVGRTFFQDREVFRFNLSPEQGYQFPGMVNLQQFYLEQFAVERARSIPTLDLRLSTRVTSVEPMADGVRVLTTSPEGPSEIGAEYVIAADGVRSTTRSQLGLATTGQVFSDRFLIADIAMQASFPAERWFWFDPPFNPGRSALLHKQADDVWRVDFQLAADADPIEERKPEKVVPRIRALLGDDRPFELVWTSVYSFRCNRMDCFRHGRVLFIGDAAHQVSPFGARGANSGIQDAENVAWKLRMVLNGEAPERLLDTYDEERRYAADENIRQSTRSTDFIAPRSSAMRRARDAVLQLAREHSFARALINSGRLSEATRYLDSSLSEPDCDHFVGPMCLGWAAEDVPLSSAGRREWLVRALGGDFVLVGYHETADELSRQLAAAAAASLAAPMRVRTLAIAAKGSAAASRASQYHDVDGWFRRRYDALPGSVYLFRPDQHLAARWRAPEAEKITRALRRACAIEGE